MIREIPAPHSDGGRKRVFPPDKRENAFARDMLEPRSERVAQAVEHVTFNHGVAGSSPAALTKLINNLEPRPQIAKEPLVCNLYANQLPCAF